MPNPGRVQRDHCAAPRTEQTAAPPDGLGRPSHTQARKTPCWPCGLRWTALVLLGCCAVAGCKARGSNDDPSKPPDAWVAYPIFRMVEDYEDFTGSTKAENEVVVKARATGHLKKVNFKDGAMVRQDDVLFEIDHREYKSALDKATAELNKAEVRVSRLESDYERSYELLRKGSTSREQFDQISSDLGEARANVRVLQASKISADYNLAWCKVTAEISGRISRRMVDAGNVIEKEKTVLTNIVSLDPMFAVFDIDERSVLRLQKNVKDGKLLLSQDHQLRFKIGLADETGYSIDGKIDFVDNKIDTGTGTLSVRGTFDNTMFIEGTWPWERPTNFRLPPGLFIRVRLPVGDPQKRLLVPEKAILPDQDKKFVYIVNKNNEVERRGVKLGSLQEDGLRIIEEGLTIEDMVIVKGLQRMRPKLPDGSPMVVEPREDTGSISRGP